jgi:hypothetical protein
MARRVLERLVPPAIVAAVVGALFSQTRHYGLLGFDSYPIIATSRVGSLTDLLGNFTEKLMDGRYPSDFHRPLINFSFALDDAVWGLDAFGYQLTNALLLALCAWAMWGLLRRLLGPDAWLGSLIGMLVFLLSALQYEVLPVPPRRPELLCCLFTALALRLQLAPRALRAQSPPVWPAVATLLAVASKESGFVIPVLVAVTVALYADRPTLRERVRQVATALVPHLAAVAIMVIARFAVLGGLGGHRSLRLSGVLTDVPAALRIILDGLLLPQPAMVQSIPGRWLLAVLPVALIATLVWAELRARKRPDRRAGSPPAKAAVVGLAWVALLGLTYAAAGLIAPWYLVLPLAGWAILAGSMTEHLLALACEDERPTRWLAQTSLALLIALLVWQASYSPLFRRYDEWERATFASETFLQETQARISSADVGMVVQAPPLPTWVAPRTEGPTIRGAAIFADYSVQAWADLTLPERNVRVAYATADTPPPAANEILLLITRRLERF